MRPRANQHGHADGGNGLEQESEGQDRQIDILRGGLDRRAEGAGLPIDLLDAETHALWPTAAAGGVDDHARAGGLDGSFARASLRDGRDAGAEQRREIQRVWGCHHVVDAGVAEDMLELQTAEEARQRHDRLARNPSGELRHRPVNSIGAEQTDDLRQAAQLRRHAGDTGGELSSRERALVVRHRRRVAAKARAVMQDPQELSHEPKPWQRCPRKGRSLRGERRTRLGRARNRIPSRRDGRRARGPRPQVASAAGRCVPAAP